MMSQRLACPPAPGPLEDFAAAFDPLFATLAQRRGFRAYLQGLLLPRERNKTLTALVGTEPVVGAQAAPVQRLQWFLSEAAWDVATVNTQRLAVLFATSATRIEAWVFISSFARGSNSAVGSFERPPMLMTAPQSRTCSGSKDRMSSTTSSTRSRNERAGSRPKNSRSSTRTE